MKRIAILKSEISLIGGIEKNLWRIADSFSKKGCEVILLASHTIENCPYQVHTTNLSGLPSFLKMIKFDQFCSKWVKINKPDVVFGMDRTSCQTHLRAGNGSHLAYLNIRSKIEGPFKRLSFHLNPLHRAILSLEKKAFESRDLNTLFVNSFMVKKQVLSHYAIDPEKIQVVHNGVEWEEMKNDFSLSEEKKLAIAEEYHLDPDLPTFLFVGNGFKRKGLDLLLEALGQLDAQLIVLGYDKKLKSYIRKAENLKMGSRVFFLGKVFKTRSFYQFADALVLPSFYDPFANVTLEALAMGLFVITSKTNGGHEVITSQNGIIIEDLFQIDSLVEALQCSINKPKTLRRATQIRNSVKHLDYSKQLENMINLCL